MDLKTKYSFFQKLSLDKLYVSFLGLQPREQTLVLILAGAFATALVLSPIVLATSKLGALRERVVKASQSLVQVEQKLVELGEVQEELKVFEARYRGGSQSVSTALEAIASSAGISGSIDSIKERPGRTGSDILEEKGVDVRISKVSLEALVRFLRGIETNEGVHLQIKSLQIKPRFKTRSQLDANMEVVSFGLKREEP